MSNARVRRPWLGLALLAAGALCLAPLTPRASAEDIEGTDPETAKIRHLLRRSTFGVRPDDVERVREMGREAWIDWQLEPAVIPDPEVDKRLEDFRTLKLTGPDYWQMIGSGQMSANAGPPGEGEDRIARARRRQQEINRLRNLGRREVPEAVILRAVYSERQLFEVMREFWRNHFNVDVNKDDVRYYIPDWEREVLGKHVFGKFEDFLMATAKHPAMLFYLDNHVSQAPMANAAKVLQGREREERTGGLNENYARELMELHTVGVDNGYTQKDVIQLALVLTGWSIEGAGADRGTFTFRKRYHASKSAKRVMGKTVKGGDIGEGEAVIKHLARHKNTRHFVVTKMARYLQADEPSEKLVSDVCGVWKKTKGDLGKVTRAILTHDDFYAKPSLLTKAKTPFEFVVSSLRITGADVKSAQGVLGRLADMGQPVYQCEDPTGYSDEARDWMDPGVLAVRWQFAYDLLGHRMPGVKVDRSRLFEHVAKNPEVWEYLLIEELLANERTGSLTMAPFRKRIQMLRKNYRRMRPAALEREYTTLATLLMGSPEFQRQ